MIAAAAHLATWCLVSLGINLWRMSFQMSRLCALRMALRMRPGPVL